MITQMIFIFKVGESQHELSFIIPVAYIIVNTY